MADPVTDARLRDEVFNIIYTAGLDGTTYVEATDKVCEAVALQLGRDLLDVGIGPFIERLVGADNATRLWARHAGEGS